MKTLTTGRATIEVVLHEANDYYTQTQYLIFNENQEKPKSSIRETKSRYKAQRFEVHTYATASTQHFETLSAAMSFAINLSK